MCLEIKISAEYNFHLSSAYLSLPTPFTVRPVVTLLALLLLALGALADVGRAPPAASAQTQAASPDRITTPAETDVRPWSGPRRAAAGDDVKFRSDGVAEAFDVQGEPDDRAEVMPADAADLRLPVRPHAWAAVAVSRAPAPWLAGPLRPPRPLDA